MGKTCPPCEKITLISPNSESVDTLILYDRGSDHTIICDSLRNYFCYKSPVSYTLITSTSSEIVKGFLVGFTVKGKFNTFSLQGLTKNMSQSSVINSEKFNVPKEWQNSFNLPSSITTSSGQNLIILGNDAIFAMAIEIRRKGNLSLFMSVISGNLFVSGHSHPPLAPSVTAPVSMSIVIRKSNIMKNFSHQDRQWLESMDPPNFQYIPRLCTAHSNTSCQDCLDILENKSPYTRFEESQLSKSLEFQPSNDPSQPGKWIIHGISNSLVESLPSYKSEVLQMMKNLESKLIKKQDILHQFNQEMLTKIKSGFYIFEKDYLKIDPKFQSYQENFAPLNYTRKLNSTTPTRPILNCSFKTPGNISYNDTQYVGSSLNLKIIDVLLILRSYKYIGISDISKMYNNLINDAPTMAMNKMYFKPSGLGSDEPFEPLLSTVLQFGKSEAQFLANYAKIQTSSMFIAPIDGLADTNVKESYSDDLHAGSNKSLDDVKTRAMTISDGLAKGSFPTKPWIFSYDPAPSTPFGGSSSHSSLGLIWEPPEDDWSLSIHLNISKKYRGTRNSKFQIKSIKDAENLIKTHGFSKRMALRLAHMVFDPLHLLINIRSNLNLLYRELITSCPQLKYEDPVPSSFLPQWLSVIKMMLECIHVKLPRYVLTGSSSNDAILAVFTDGSAHCSCSRLFLRFEVSPGVFQARYLCGNTKIAPPGFNPASRTEVEAGLLGLRLAELVHKRLSPSINITRTILLTDSTILLGGLSNLHCQQKMFYSVRNSESQSIIKKLNVELYHVESHNQDADLASKINLSRNFALEDFYWNSSWLHLPESQWPVKLYTFDSSHVIDILNPRMISIRNQNVLPPFLQSLFEKFSSFRKIHNVVSLLFVVSYKISTVFDLKDIETSVDYVLEASEKAKIFLLNYSKISDEELSGMKRNYLVEKINSISYVKPRTLMIHGATKQHSLIAISISSPIAVKLLNDFHIHVSSPSYEIANMFQQGYFITKARNWFIKKQHSCFTCTKIRKLHVDALLGPSNHLQAAANVPVLAVAYMDIAGHFWARLTRKVSKKIYCLILTCMWSRFSILTLLTSLTADAVLMAIREAANSIGGNLPHIILSDSATNFLPLQKADDDANMSTTLASQLKKLLLSNRIVLKTSSPKSSWRQSKAEIMVSLWKQNLKRSQLYQKKLDITEWNYCMKRIQLIINSRALNIRAINESLFTLTPNHLVFGSRKDFYPRDIDVSTFSNINLYRSLHDLDLSISQFHDLWTNTYNIEMLKWSKFKNKSHDLKVNSIVYILDRINKDTNQPTLGRIIEEISPRTFKVEYDKKSIQVDPDSYKVTRTAKKAKLTRPAQQLCLLVPAHEDVPTRGLDVDPFDDQIFQMPDVPADIAVDEDEIPIPGDSAPVPTDNALDSNEQSNDSDSEPPPLVMRPPAVKVSHQPDSSIPTISNLRKRKKNIP